MPRGLRQLSATLPPYKSDWKRVNFKVRFLMILFLSRGEDLTIDLLDYKYQLIMGLLASATLTVKMTMAVNNPALSVIRQSRLYADRMTLIFIQSISTSICLNYNWIAEDYRHLSNNTIGMMQAMIARRLLPSSRFYSSSKKSGVVVKPASNTLVDFNDYRKPGIIAKIINKYKTSNALGDATRNFQGFSKSVFEQQALDLYLKVCQCSRNRNHRDLFNYVSEQLHREFKVQAKSSREQTVDLGWSLLGDVNKAKIMQARKHIVKMTRFKSLDVWYQITCQFSNPEGRSTCAILERHEAGPQFQFVKFHI